MADLRQRDASVLRRFEAFCALEGIPSPDVARGSAAVVEAFLAIGCAHVAPHSRGTYRSTLTRLAGVTTPSEFPASSAAPPYGPHELTALSSIVTHQPSPARTQNATVSLSTMVGAGLRPREVAQLQRSDLERRHGEVRVLVRGPHPRVVPLSPPYGEALWRVASSRRDLLFRPGATQRSTKNLVGEICAGLVRDPVRSRSLAPGRGPPSSARTSRRERRSWNCANWPVWPAWRASCATPATWRAPVQGRAAREGSRVLKRAMIRDEDLERAAALLDRSGVAEWLEEELRARHQRPGRPRQLSARALLVALLLLASDDRPLHLTGVTEVLFSRVSACAQRSLGVVGNVNDQRSFLALPPGATSLARSLRCSTPRDW
ncbi:MAG: hypothetical protein ACRDVC_02220 [Acidimicrobiales bacterium]